MRPPHRAARGARPRGVITGLALVLVATVVTALPTSSLAAVTPVAHGSAEQVWVTDVTPGATATLLDQGGATVGTETVDAQGGVLFRLVSPGTGYRVQVDGMTSAPVTVHSNAPEQWNPAIYDQTIPDSGYGYLTTRDGTQLAYAVHLPTAPATLGIGLPDQVEQQIPNLGLPYTPPYPTLIEYSGYGFADPKGPDSGIAALANLMGFAVVDVNMRGTGCSGGAYDFFEPLQQLDAYDVIETVARQSWVKGHKVGMLGISYGGISQLFAAALNPPSLAAISPLSTIDSVATTLYPGGVLNTGFAVAWAKERQQEAQPAGAGLSGTQPYAEQRIAGGDATCLANQALHGEAADLMAKINANSHYNAAVADPLDPITFVDKIKVPVFMACQWVDEQTGGHCPMLVQHFTGTTKKWFTFTNGAHVDSLDPATFNRLFDFLELYVAHESPLVKSALLRLVAPVVYQEALGTPASDIMTLPSDPIQLQPSYAGALKQFEKLPHVRVLFDNGVGHTPVPGLLPVVGSLQNPALESLFAELTGPLVDQNGNPYPAYEQSYSALPVPGTQARSWYLGAGGTLTAALPTTSTISRYTANGADGTQTSYVGGRGGASGTGGLWGNASQWTWDWQPHAAGKAVSYLSAPLTQNVTVVGAGAVYVWVRSSASDVDLQATVSEVRPDGNETMVQSGWMRASERKLATNSDDIFRQPSTLLEPVPSLLASDVQPLPAGQFVKVAIPLYYEGHAYRAGSRLRVTISGVGGDMPVWSFDGALPSSDATVDIASSLVMPSRLVLPVIPNQSVPTGLPACPGLRNEPCRPYTPLVNQTVAS